MSAPLRFLALAIVGWVGIRAATLGALPGSEAFTLTGAPPAVASTAAPSGLPPIIPTEFPALEPVAQAPQPMAGALPFGPGLSGAQFAAGAPFYYYAPPPPPRGAQYYRASLPAPSRPRPLTELAPVPEPLFYAPIPQLDDWPLSRMASAAMPARRSSVGSAQQSVPPAFAAARLDRLQLTAWALLRGRQGVLASPRSLADGGTLGGSQAGARITYNFSPALAATLRSSSQIGYRGGEVAAGIKLKPFRSIPVALTAERRQALGRFGGGRSAFAMFLEGGVYQRPVPWGFELDAYAQAGIVGARRRDMFADGGFTLMRPVFGRFSAGMGMWGGVQPGLYRVDAGPRVSMRVRHNMRVHVDWRHRLAGNAEPGSGPAVTLAGDF